MKSDFVELDVSATASVTAGFEMPAMPAVPAVLRRLGWKRAVAIGGAIKVVEVGVAVAGVNWYRNRGRPPSP